MNTRVDSKSSILFEALDSVFDKKINKARVKLISLFIIALNQVRTVNFEKLAIAFNHDAKKDSSLRRIQRFIADFDLQYDLIARLVFNLLPAKPPYRLSMDRTNWKFGSKNINILVLAITYKGIAFPLLFKVEPKAGNSSTQQRINIINDYIKLFGLETIDCLLADREFIGERWIGYLNINRIRYHIRTRNNFWVTMPRTVRRVKASWLFNQLKINQFKFHENIVKINNVLCYISGSKVFDKDGKPELQIIISFNNPQRANDLYKERWQIESAFKGLKSSGFHFEDTHLTDPDRVQKLFALVIIAFTWAYVVGIALDKLTPIKIKKHGRRAKSLMVYGLDYIANILFRNDLAELRVCCDFLSCT
jgi:hypothetical protein